MTDTKTKIVIENVEGRGTYIKVFDKYGNFFMGSPLSISLPKEPSNLIHTDKDDFEARHLKWVSKCKNKIEKYLEGIFNHNLYGNLEISFKGFGLETKNK